jgi:Raf kinase inhibitor-like YbhB/YbcL family protein
MMLEKLPESIGHALIHQRAGMENVVYNQLHRQRAVARIDLHSRAFVFNGPLPTRCTADGDGVSPPLDWDKVPGTASLALIVEDADSPTPHPWVHAIAIGLESVNGSMEEGALSGSVPEGAALRIGQNSFLSHAWLPPDPPRGHGVHRYVFQLFALRPGPVLHDAPGRKAFIDLVLDRAVGVGCLIGTYDRDVRVDSGAETVDGGLLQEAGLGAAV